MFIGREGRGKGEGSEGGTGDRMGGASPMLHRPMLHRCVADAPEIRRIADALPVRCIADAPQIADVLGFLVILVFLAPLPRLFLLHDDPHRPIQRRCPDELP